MQRELAARRSFCSFLERLSNGDIDDSDWQKHVVTHYRDEFLEEFRRCVARFEVKNDLETEARRQTLIHWAAAIKLSVPKTG